MDVIIPNKSYFSIGEVTKITGVKHYILRYWESEFKLLRPIRRESGQRRYTRRDLELIIRIKEILQQKGHTIAGAKKLIQEENRNKNQQLQLDIFHDATYLTLLKEVKKELSDLLKIM
ncbi:MAG: MerR family transcriptional regulator [Elusimicrobiota bacterium]